MFFQREKECFEFEEIFPIDLEDEKKEEENFVISLSKFDKNSKEKIESCLVDLDENLWYYKIFEKEVGTWWYLCKYCDKKIKYNEEKSILNHLNTFIHQQNVQKKYLERKAY
jgi:hypothetical protein